MFWKIDFFVFILFLLNFPLKTKKIKEIVFFKNKALLVDNITLRTSLANTKRKAKHLRYELQRSLAKNNAVEIEKREASEKYAAHLMALKGSVKNCQEIANRISGRQIVAHSLENYNLVIENTVLLAEKLSLQKQVEILDEKLLKFKSAAKAAQGRRKKEKMEAID